MAEKKLGVRQGSARLDTATIVDAALTLAQEVGVDGISMRLVAERVGVTPMALYRHVETKDALVKLVADAVVAQVVIPDVGAEQWRAMLIGAMNSYRMNVKRYPGMAALLLHGGLRPQARAVVSSALDLLENAGFTPEQARRGFASFHLLLLGQLTVDEARHTKMSRGSAHVDDPRIDAFVAELQSDQAFTNLAQIFLDDLEGQLTQAPESKP